MGWQLGTRPTVAPSPPSSDPVVEMAYEAAVKAVEQQTSTLNDLRNRSAGLLSAITIATTFGAGLGLFSADATKGPTLPSWSQWVLLGLLVVTGGLSIAVMWPVRVTFGPDAGKILEKHETEKDADAVRLYVTRELIAGHRRNVVAVGKKFRLYRLSVFGLIGEITILVLALILKGRS